MVDPFQGVVRRELITRVGWLALLIAFLCILSFAWTRADVIDGRDVKATVVALGSYPDPRGTGDSPLLTVRLPDGSTRQVLASWPAVSRCMPGRSVELRQRGPALKMGLRGCYLAH